MFAIHIFNGFLIYKFAQKLKLSQTASIIASILYTTSPIHFGSLYWWSGFYVGVGSTFFILSLLTFLSYFETGKIIYAQVTLILFTAMLLSNESLFLTPFIFVFLAHHTKKIYPRILIGLTFLISIISFIFHIAVSKFAQVPDYQLGSFIQTFKTAHWYIYRLINLPEAVQSMANPQKYILYLLTLIMLSWFITIFYKNYHKILSSYYLKLGILIFLFTASPFFLLPNHLSSYYLDSGFVGISLMLGFIYAFGFSSNNKPLEIISSISLILFFITSLISVNFMNQTSWIVWRGEIARKYILKVKDQYPALPKGATVVFENTSVPIGELNVALYGDKALRLYYNDKTLNVIYGKKTYKPGEFIISDR